MVKRLLLSVSKSVDHSEHVRDMDYMFTVLSLLEELQAIYETYGDLEIYMKTSHYDMFCPVVQLLAETNHATGEVRILLAEESIKDDCHLRLVK